MGHRGGARAVVGAEKIDDEPTEMKIPTTASTASSAGTERAHSGTAWARRERGLGTAAVQWREGEDASAMVARRP